MNARISNRVFHSHLLHISSSALRKFTIRSHMTFGGIAILCSPIQMITPFTSAWKKSGVNRYRQIHRYSGRVYVLCAILSFIFGQWFIFLKEFVLVGGYNMGLAFSAAGFAIAYFSYMTWKTAPSRNTDGRYTVEVHRNYAIRSFGQIIAPILYRYWYIMLVIFNAYRAPNLNGGDGFVGEKLVCNDRDVCEDYERPFDAIYSWLYWISAWAVSEIVIVCLPKHQRSNNTPENQVGFSLVVATTEERCDSNGEVIGGSPPDIAGKTNNKTGFRVVNFVGCLLAVLTTIVSIGIVVLLFTH